MNNMIHTYINICIYIYIYICTYIILALQVCYPIRIHTFMYTYIYIQKKLGLSTDRHNPRAFSVSGIVKTKRTQQRNLDKAQKKELVPLINRVGGCHAFVIIIDTCMHIYVYMYMCINMFTHINMYIYICIHIYICIYICIYIYIYIYVYIIFQSPSFSIKAQLIC
jgi:hypothetical protein